MSAIFIICILFSSSTLLVSSTTLIIPYDDNFNSLPLKFLPWPLSNVKYEWQNAPTLEPTPDSSQVMQEQVQFVLQEEPIVQQKEPSPTGLPENSNIPSASIDEQLPSQMKMQLPSSDEVVEQQKNTLIDEQQNKIMDQQVDQQDEQVEQGQQKEDAQITQPKPIVQQQQSQYTSTVEQQQQLEQQPQQQQQQQDEGENVENISQYKQDPRQEEDSPFLPPNEPTDKVPTMKKEPKIPVFITRDPSKIIALSRMYAKKFRGLMRSEDKSHEASLTQEDPNESTSDGETFNSESSEENASPATEESEVEEANDQNVPTAEQSLPVATSELSDPSEDSITIPARDPSKTIPVIAISGVEPHQVFRQRVRPAPQVVPQVTKESIEENKKLTRRQKNYLARVLDDYFKFILDFQSQKKKQTQTKKTGEDATEKLTRRSGLFGSWKRNIKSLFMPIMTMPIRNARSFKPFIPVPPEPLVSIAVLGKK